MSSMCLRQERMAKLWVVDSGLLVDAGLVRLARLSPPAIAAALQRELRALTTTIAEKALNEAVGTREVITPPITLAEVGWVARPKAERRNGRHFLAALDEIRRDWKVQVRQPRDEPIRAVRAQFGFADATLVALLDELVTTRQEPQLLTIDGPLARWCAENDRPCILFDSLLRDLR